MPACLAGINLAVKSFRSASDVADLRSVLRGLSCICFFYSLFPLQAPPNSLPFGPVKAPRTKYLLNCISSWHSVFPIRADKTLQTPGLMRGDCILYPFLVLGTQRKGR